MLESLGLTVETLLRVVTIALGLWLGLLAFRMTRLRRSQSQALRASRAKSEYLASLTHEIRTPLAAILGFSELLLEPNQSVEERTGFVRIIKRNGELLSQIIGNVLDLSKIEAGRVEIESMPVDMRQVVDEVVESLGCRAQAKGLALVRDVHELPSNLALLTDPTRVKQILVNLVGNAIKFTDRGEVRVTAHLLPGTQPDRDVVELVVKDSGIGFSSSDAERIFQVYTQAERTTTRLYGGTGLGLSLSRQLARLLGGDVELVESRIGEGSTFRFWLEARRVGREAPRITPSRPVRESYPSAHASASVST